MGAGASQSMPVNRMAVNKYRPTAPPLPLNNKQKLFKANQSTKMSEALARYKNLSNVEKEVFLSKTQLPRYIFTEFNKASPQVQKAIITEQSHALLTESPSLNPNNLQAGGRMKTRKRRATKKVHKNSRRHSRRN